MRRSVLNPQGIFGNRSVWLGIAAVVAFQIAFTYWPVMGDLFHVAPLDAGMWLRVLGASPALFLLVETEKAIARQFARWQRTG